MKKLLFFLFIGLFSNAFIFAQSSISGTVTITEGAIKGVSVTTTPGNKGTTTDINGNYKLNLNPGSYKVSFSNTGYISNTLTVILAADEMKIVDVTLKENPDKLEDIVVVGTRSQPRSSINTPLPVDNVDAATLKSTGQPSFDKALQYRVPSFNTVNTPVNDASTLLDPYEIRNLGPSRTLILINGKRKNLSSLLYVQFSPGRG